jgi:hypothetical protein
MLHETTNAEYMWATVQKSPELAGTNPELIAWGVDASADILCWDLRVTTPAPGPAQQPRPSLTFPRGLAGGAL